MPEAAVHEDHHRRRRLAIGERLPAMQRHHRQLQPEAQQQQGQHPGLRRRGEAAAGQGLEAEIHRRGSTGQGTGLARALAEPAEGQHSGQQAEAGDGPVQQEAHGGPGPALAAPDGHQQGGGDQHQLEGQHKQQGVLGQEGADHAQVGGQQQRVVEPGATLVDGGGEHRHRREQGREQHQRQRESIKAELQPQAQARQPAQGQVGRRLAPGQQPHRQLGQGHSGRQATHQGAPALRQQRQQHPP